MEFVTADDETGAFTVNPAALTLLRGITDDVAIVAIAGLQRTGKSFLLDQLTGLKAGFAIGNTQKACTRGIWLHTLRLEPEAGASEGAHLTVVFLDTEGLSSTSRSHTFDARVFSLALLLSSYFVYNSRGTIDGTALNDLSLVVELTKNIHVNAHADAAEEDGAHFAEFFPEFLWVVRDFALDLVDARGKRMTQRQYFERAIKDSKENSDHARRQNHIKHVLRGFFPQRDCVCLVRPVNEEERLQTLSTIPLEEMRPEFQSGMNALREKILGRVKPKVLFGNPLQGKHLAALAESYVEALNTGSVPTIATAWRRVVENQLHEALDEATAHYRAAMERGVGGMQQQRSESETGSTEKAAAAPTDATASQRTAAATTTTDPIESDALLALHKASASAALAIFERSIIKEEGAEMGAHREQLLVAIDEAYVQLRAENARRSQSFCAALAAEVGAATFTSSSAVAAVRTASDAARDVALAKAREAARGRGDEEEEEALALERAARSAHARPAELLTTLLRWQSRSASATRAEYLARAKGPKQWECLAEWLAGDAWMEAMREGADVIDELLGAQLSAQRREARTAAKELAKQRARAEQTEQSLERERAAHERALQSAHSASESERRHMQVQLDSATKELGTQSKHHNYALAQLEKALEDRAKRVAELEGQSDAMRTQLTSSAGLSDGEASQLREEMRAIGLKREREAMSADAERKVMLSQLGSAQDKVETLQGDKLELKERNAALEARYMAKIEKLEARMETLRTREAEARVGGAGGAEILRAQVAQLEDKIDREKRKKDAARAERDVAESRARVSEEELALAAATIEKLRKAVDAAEVGLSVFSPLS